MTELVSFLIDSFLNRVGELLDRYYHGQTVAKTTIPTLAKVTGTRTTSRGHSATSSKGSLRQKIRT
jgi:hypothetical protein